MRARIATKTLYGKSYVLAASAQGKVLWKNRALKKVERKTFSDLFSN